MSRVLALLLAQIVSLSICYPLSAEFPGWQGIRVIEQEGRPYHLRAGDIDGDDCMELLVVNGRSSRIDIYQWLKADERSEQQALDPDEPNDLPFAKDLKHEELQLEHVPKDLLVRDVDGDKKPELIILSAPPNRLSVFQRNSEGEWTRAYKIDLLEGDLSSRRESLLYRETDKDNHELLVSLDEGIQRVELKAGGKAKWLTPREQRDRVHWWLADLNADGIEDLVEQSREANESIRWYPGLPGGALSPASVLLDRSVNDAEVLSVPGAAQLVVMDGSVRHLLRRYRVAQGEKSPFGLQHPLALPAGKSVAWCGLQLGSSNALVMADPNAPRLLSYVLNDKGWETEQAYPSITDVLKLAPLPSQPGTLLIWSKDSADLRVSRWESERLSYPETMTQSGEVEDRKILALDAVGKTTWWAQRVEKHLDLYIASQEAAEPQHFRLEGVGRKADQVLWIGGSKVMLKEKHARELKLVELLEGKTKVSSPTHLKKATLSQFKLVAVGEEFRLAKLTDGVLQWLGDDLQSKEQVMLSQGQELSDYVALEAQRGWALQQGSAFIHEIEIDSSGLSHSQARYKVCQGKGLVQDAHLGLMLVGHDRVTHVSAGRPWELSLVDLVDKRVARSGGIKETKFHRMDTVDIDGDSYDDLVLFDDMKHRVMVLADQGGTFKPKISWPVFDDQVYPYDDEGESQVKEPRAVLAADFDGDQQQDLALLCHDRLLIYFAREHK